MLVCLTVLPACRDGATTTEPDPTVPTAVPSSTSSTAPAAPDITVVPAIIDEPYVNAVLAALDEIDGRATRIIVSTKSVPKEALTLLQAIFGTEQFLLESGSWLESLRQDPQLTNVRPDAGARVTTAERIIAASRSCIWLAVRRDRSGVNVDPGPSRTEYVELRPVDRANDPGGFNRTPWAIVDDGRTEDDSEPANPCPGS